MPPPTLAAAQAGGLPPQARGARHSTTRLKTSRGREEEENETGDNMRNYLPFRAVWAALAPWRQRRRRRLNLLAQKPRAPRLRQHLPELYSNCALGRRGGCRHSAALAYDVAYDVAASKGRAWFDRRQTIFARLYLNAPNAVTLSPHCALRTFSCLLLSLQNLRK